MELNLENRLKKELPDLLITPFIIHNVKIERESKELEDFKEKVIEEIKKDYKLETVKDSAIIRLYRNFYWRSGIDPTKVRPASEALIRRVLKGQPLPKINTLVDAYNLASMKTNIALAAFDLKTLKGSLTMRFSKQGEEFQGIGMEKPIILKGNEPVIADTEKTIAVYPYRDSDSTKVTLKTKDVLILVCGVPGITDIMMKKTAKVSIEYITRFCGGKTEF